MRSILRSPRGSALIGAMSAVAVAGIVGVSAIAYNQSYLAQSRINYVRSVMATVEANVRSMAMQPYAYVCDAGVVGADQAGASSCTLNTLFFDGDPTKINDPTVPPGVQRLAMPGAKCATPGACGVALQARAFAFDPVTKLGTFTATIGYEGTEASIAPIKISMTVPNDVLQAQEIHCPPNKPVFGGVNADGTPNCKSFPDCGAGSYVTSINFTPKLKFGCTDLAPQSNKLNCSGANDQPMISAIRWNNGVVDKSCDYVATPPPATSISDPIVSPPLPQSTNCPDTTYTDTQGIHVGYGQNSMTNATINFQSAVDQIASNCKYSSVTIDLRRAGVFGSSCAWPGQYPSLTPGGPAGSLGFINGGGSGNKTMYGTAVVNGPQAYLTEASGGWGSAGGMSTAACISNVVVTVHSVPK